MTPWHDAVTTHKFAQLQTLRRSDRIDVIFAGTSQVLIGIDPAIATPPGLRGYNAGLHRAVPTVTKRWLLKAVVPRARPRVVVLGASLLDLNDHGPFHREILRRFAASAPQLSPATGFSRLAATRVAPRLRHPKRLLREVAARSNADLPQTRAVGYLRPDGFSEEFVGRGYLVSEAKQAMLTDEIAAGFASGGEQLGALEQLMRELAALGIPVLLCEMPVRPEFVALFPGGRTDSEAAAAGLREAAARAGAAHTSVADMQDKQWFADPIHLNGDGAIELSNRLKVEVASLASGPLRPGSDALGRRR